MIIMVGRSRRLLLLLQTALLFGVQDFSLTVLPLLPESLPAWNYLLVPDTFHLHPYKEAVDLEFRRGEDGKGIPVQPCPEEPAAKVRSHPQDGEGLSDVAVQSGVVSFLKECHLVSFQPLLLGDILLNNFTNPTSRINKKVVMALHPYTHSSLNMAFMMPVVKNGYDIYASRSRRSSSVASSVPSSRRSTQSQPPSLSCSPGSDVEVRLAVSLGTSPQSIGPLPPPRKSSSQSSLTKFPSRVVDKLRRKLRHSKEDLGADDDLPRNIS
ncbi:hypothetical protein LAZ67_18000236 [Cordylochernes scorpioides]|uniref:Uncharacterized protein n=1 Tax=Cordylochernes scorpioides TaxID=51811 RepID=A0ABY6LGV8_9ARAC|nr:hypothetical protein LAZ67_18000236 [Cordylochernes scorpioides]